MDFELIRTFGVVASVMSFSRAAELMHCTQSTVSARMKMLEDDLGTPLFQRLGRRIALTASGEELLHRARRALSFEGELYAAVRSCNEEKGLLSLRVPQSMSVTHLPAILHRFHPVYPHVGFDVSNCGYFRIADQLRSGQIDAAFLLSSSVESADLETTMLFTEPMAYVASPSSDLAKRTGLSYADFANQVVLLPKHDCGYRMELEQELRSSEVETSAVFELNSVEAIVSCAAAGIGVALLPHVIAAPAIAEGRLALLDWAAPFSVGLFLIRHRDKPRVGFYGAFLDAVEEHFAAQRATQGPTEVAVKSSCDSAGRRGSYDRRL